MRTEPFRTSLLVGVLGVACGVALAQSHQVSGPPPQPILQAPAIPDMDIPMRDGTLSPRQKLVIMQVNLNKAKNDAAELAAVAKELRAELAKPNVNRQSPEVASRAERISKLARKIRDETRAY